MSAQLPALRRFKYAVAAVLCSAASSGVALAEDGKSAETPSEIVPATAAPVAAAIVSAIPVGPEQVSPAAAVANPMVPAATEERQIFFFTREDGTATFDPKESVAGMTSVILPASDPRVAAFDAAGGKSAIFLDREKRKSRDMELAFHTLNAIDAAETLIFLKKGTARELNPIYGGNPSAVTLLATKAAASGLFHVALNALRKEKPELVKPVQYFSIAFMGGMVAWNAQFVF